MDEFSFGKILLLAVIILLVFGARRLPEIGASMGKGIREFKRSLSDTQDALNKPVASDDQQRLASSQRVIDDKVPAPTGGEPKRLSQ
ncbi:MAG TPA: twin-arginine translocase TatA/TatE family subunit [Gemmatimonadales bacterium]|jgi:sec-independent protein translocase protein TatA|nr:twin-arginine translocase TatA/TatE family subunit [Gemmatimonadales bacterium]